MREPPSRDWKKEAVKYVAARLDLRNEPDMQDWPYEVADPACIDQYLSLFKEAKGDDDVRYLLADMIIQAFDELNVDAQTDARWATFLLDLGENSQLHAHQIWYWSAFGVPRHEAWNVTADMRYLARRLA